MVISYLAAIAIALHGSSDHVLQLRSMATAMLLYAVAGLGVHFLGRIALDKPLAKPLVFAFCLLVFLVPPLLDRELALAPTQVLGWEYSLASYSYVAETRRTGTRRPIRDFFFFLFLSQTLVFSAREREGSTENRRVVGLLRALLGLGSLTIGLTLQLHGWRAAFQKLAPETLISAFLTIVLFGLGLFVAEYLGHSGRASLTIGTMGALGYQLPERYRYPFLALTPEDFWRRWNSYVTRWARIYVYLPLTRALSGEDGSHRAHSYGAAVVSMLATFSLIGLLHDIDLFTRDRMLQLRWTPMFTLLGAVVLAANLARRTLQRIRATRRAAQGLALVGRRFVTHVLMLFSIGSTAWILLH